MTRLLALVGVVCVATVTAAQAPLPEALRAAHLVYLEQGTRIDKATIDRAAKEIQKYKPRRLELVSTQEQADVIMMLSDVSTGQGGVLYAPIAGLGLVGIPDSRHDLSTDGETHDKRGSVMGRPAHQQRWTPREGSPRTTHEGCEDAGR